jgi:hypothetical protein
MNIEDHVREAIIAELQRQSDGGRDGLKVDARDPSILTIEGCINIDELTMAIVGSLAGGP